MLIFLLIKICVSIYLEKFIGQIFWTHNMNSKLSDTNFDWNYQTAYTGLDRCVKHVLFAINMHSSNAIVPIKIKLILKKLNNKTKEVDVNNIFQSLCIMNNNKSDAWHNHRVCVLSTEQLQFITPWSTNNVVYCLYVFFFIY